MDIADVLIHINETLETDQRGQLEEALRKSRGVIAPRFNSGSPHLLLVAYDPEATGSHNLLATVKAGGCNAQLVGM